MLARLQEQAWVPAFAGMSGEQWNPARLSRFSRFAGDGGLGRFAGAAPAADVMLAAIRTRERLGPGVGPVVAVGALMLAQLIELAIQKSTVGPVKDDVIGTAAADDVHSDHG
jgi:hypothetical protein